MRCLVIEGAGDHFMAGGDLKYFLGQFQANPDPEARRRLFENFIHELHPAIFALRRMRKPVIASVQGACAGFGLSLAMACDLTIAADNAYFTLAYINIATSPDGSGTYFLPRLVGLKTAMEIALLGDRFDATRAQARGLVNFVVPQADLAAETANLAARLASGPTHAIANTKALLNASLSRDLEAQLAADPDAIVVTMGLHPGSPNLGVISLAHSYGFSNLVLPLLLHGIPLVLVPSPLPAALWAAAQCYPEVPLTLPAVPALWRAWHEAQAIPRNVGLAISAGAPLSLPLEQAVFQEQGLKLHNFLGASECGGIAYDATQTPRTDARLAGTPLQGVRLNQGLNGCLEVCGPAAGTGYWPEEDGPLQQGVFRTSDLVELSPEGAVHLRGRLSDVIQIAGRKVSPETIEVVLREHGSVRDCLVLGVPSGEARGEAVAAVIELASDVPEAILRRHLQDRLPAWQVPRLWVRVDSLGVNGRGKRSRAEWRERLPEMKMGW